MRTTSFRGTEKPDTAYRMDMQLAVESQNKPLVELLFNPHKVMDISTSVSQRKSGTDFLLSPSLHDGGYGAAIRCENKFEQYTTGRQLLELVSVDRGRMAPGWMFTSTAAWLLSWYPSGELIALPLDEARAVLFKNPLRNKVTTCRNPSYLSWSALEDLNYMVQNVEHARILDLRYELGQAPREGSRPMMYGRSLQKRCTADELMRLMSTMPAQSTPVPVTEAALKDLMRSMAPKNQKRQEHADMLAKLTWLSA